MAALKIVFLLIALLILSWLMIIPQISIRKDGITVSLPRASFYIPSDKPIKVYKFNPQPEELLDIINTNTKDYPAFFGIYIKNISTGQQVMLNADEQFNAASLYKLAVMYAIYKRGSEGKLNLSDQLIQDNLKAMITISSNEAAYFLVDNYASWKEVTDMMQQIGLRGTNLNQNPIITTPKDMGKLLELMALGKLISLETSASMLELLSAQKINDRIPVHLPPNALIAHKTGEFEDVRHDAGVIISPENNYILVLMSRNGEDPEKVKAIMVKISSKVYDFFQKQWSNPPEIL